MRIITKWEWGKLLVIIPNSRSSRIKITILDLEGNLLKGRDAQAWNKISKRTSDQAANLPKNTMKSLIIKWD